MPVPGGDRRGYDELERIQLQTNQVVDEVNFFSFFNLRFALFLSSHAKFLNKKLIELQNSFNNNTREYMFFIQSHLFILYALKVKLKR